MDRTLPFRTWKCPFYIGFVIVGLLSAARPGCAAEPVPSLEQRLKAGFVVNLAKFVEWSPSVFPQVDSPYVIEVLGADDFAQALEDEVAGKKINGRGFQVRRIQRPGEIEPCQILFIGTDQHPLVLLTILSEAADCRALTVSQSEGYAAKGVMINLAVRANKVHFEANRRAAEKAGIRFSSKFLNLASRVYPRYRMGGS